MKRKHLVQLIIGIATSVVALYFVFQGVSFGDLWDSLKAVKYRYLIPCLATFYFSVWLRGLRWRWLFKPHYDVPLSHTVSGMFICFGFNSVFPARAGEFARAYLIGKQDKMGFSTAFGTVVAERLLDALTLLPCLLIALKVAPIDPNAALSMDILGKQITCTGEQFEEFKGGVLMMALVLTLGIAFVSIPRTRGWCLAILGAMRFLPEGVRRKIEGMVNKFAEGLSAFHNPKRVVILFAMSFAIWLIAAWSIQLLAWGFDFDQRMTLLQAFALMVIVCVFIMVPAAPGYWGFFEAGIVFSLVIMGIHENGPMVVSYAILLHLTQWVPLVAIGLPLAWKSHISLDDASEAQEQAEEKVGV